MPYVCNRGQVDALYFDLSKAFDKVNHTLLLIKLSQIRVSHIFLRWFESYLTDRRCIVRILHSTSGLFFRGQEYLRALIWSHNSFWVLSMIQPLVPSIQGGCYPLIISSAFSISSIDNCKLLQNDALRILTWCSENCLVIYPCKTKVLSFS